MKLTVDYEELGKVVGFTNTIINNKSVDDKLKNVIFLVDADGTAKVAGYNQFTFGRTVLESAVAEDIPESGWEFQVKADALDKIISSFSKLYKTKVEKVDFSVEGVRIKVTVHELPLDGESERLAQDSHFMLESAPIMPNIFKEVKRDFPTECDGIVSDELYIYIDSLLPLLSNDTASTTGSKLFFADDYVFVISSDVSGFMKNNLPDAFKMLTLSYSSVAFLKRVCEMSQTIDVSKIDKYVCIHADNTEAFMRFQKPSVQHKTYLDRLKKDLGIKVDRFYLKDILRRMGNMSSDGIIRIEGDDLVVENSNFHQVVPLLNKKDGTEGLSFKINVSTLANAILGKDDVFKNDIFIYFVPSGHAYMTYVRDTTGVWTTLNKVTKA